MNDSQKLNAIIRATRVPPEQAPQALARIREILQEPVPVPEPNLPPAASIEPEPKPEEEAPDAAEFRVPETSHDRLHRGSRKRRDREG